LHGNLGNAFYALIKTKARQCAVQALYQWQMTGQDLSAIEGQFKEDQRLKNAQKSYFADLFHGVPKHSFETYSKCGVAPRITAPTAIIASYLLVAATR
jgi:hypothetical protein